MKRTRFPFRVIFCVLAVGCANTGRGEDGLAALRKLNPVSDRIRPGGIYIIDGKNNVELLINLTKNSPAGSNWLQYDKVDVASDIKHCLKSTWIVEPSNLGNRKKRVQSCIQFNDTDIISLSDVFDCLEIVNRPISGLDLNRTSDARVMQWRSTLVSNLNSPQSRNGNSVRIAICNKVEVVSNAQLIVDGEIYPDSFTSVAQDVFSRTSIVIKDGAPIESLTSHGKRLTSTIKDAFVIEANFRELVVVEGTTRPKIEVGFRNGIRIGAFKSSAGRGR